MLKEHRYTAGWMIGVILLGLVGAALVVSVRGCVAEREAAAVHDARHGDAAR